MAMQILTQNRAYSLATKDDAAELTLYGDIVETRPVDFWTGEPIEGDFITLDQFLSDLDGVKGKKALSIRLSSYGGDAGVSNMIHNRLRELANDGTELTCTVDGVAMSGGSLIMCACDTVKVYASSLIMIHKCWSSLFGSYNADELRALAKTQDAWDGAQAEIYQRKTGLSKTVITHMMSDTTYMTGREAIEKGFADELIEGESAQIAASADRRTLYVNGRSVRMDPGMQAPESLPTKVITAPAADDNTQPEGGKSMTLDELREKYPDLLQGVEAEAKASAAADAAKAERDRLAAIDEVASLFPDDLVRAAKYDKPCTAQELAYQAAIQSAKAGRKFLADLDADAKESGTQEVTAAPAAPDAPLTEAEKQAQVQAEIKRLLGGKSNG